MREKQIEGSAGRLGRYLQKLPRLRLPVTLHHDRQAMDDHVEEAADQQAKH